MPGAARLTDLGRLAHVDMPALYASVDLLFAPSAREGFGLCVAEAMACGLPVVAADTSAMPELIDRGQGGHLCPIDDLDGFAAAIRQIAAVPEEAARMGEYNRAKVESDFTLSRMVDEYRALFEELLDGGLT
jgi:glycosyltransferase involved in cell wall biosynthesis